MASKIEERSDLIRRTLCDSATRVAPHDFVSLGLMFYRKRCARCFWPLEAHPLPFWAIARSEGDITGASLRWLFFRDLLWPMQDEIERLQAENAALRAARQGGDGGEG